MQMVPPFDREIIARLFDNYGDAEWDRHEATPSARVSLHLHRHYLERLIRPMDRVLEVGAGAGRFTVELARLDARVTVTDISPEQLRLNAQHVEGSDLEGAVEGRHQADVLDLSRFEDGSFDATVCYGGPISWVLDEADRGVDELLRVTKPGGYVLMSVMSRLGTLQAFLPAAADEIERYGLEEMHDIFETGHLPDNHSSLGPMHLYTWAELRDLLEGHPCDIVVASAANLLSIANDETCERWRVEDPVAWERFLGWEIEACVQPGAIDGGTHMIVAVRSQR
jgi:SAM-dependent methyltransferase